MGIAKGFGVAGVLTGVLAGGAACSSGEVAPSVQETRPPSLVAGERAAAEGYVQGAVGRIMLTRENMCAWSPEAPQPQAADKSAWQIDGRCAYPMPASGLPEDDTPTGVYTIPRQDKGHISFRTTSGDLVTAICYTAGQEIEDGKHRTSTIWVAIGNTAGQQGLIPAFATGYALPDATCSAAELAQLAAGPTIS